MALFKSKLSFSRRRKAAHIIICFMQELFPFFKISFFTDSLWVCANFIFYLSSPNVPSSPCFDIQLLCFSELFAASIFVTFKYTVLPFPFLWLSFQSAWLTQFWLLLFMNCYLLEEGREKYHQTSEIPVFAPHPLLICQNCTNPHKGAWGQSHLQLLPLFTASSGPCLVLRFSLPFPLVMSCAPFGIGRGLISKKMYRKQGLTNECKTVHLIFSDNACTQN